MPCSGPPHVCRYISFDGIEPWTSHNAQSAMALRLFGSALMYSVPAPPADPVSGGPDPLRSPLEVTTCANETLGWVLAPDSLLAMARTGRMTPAMRVPPPHDCSPERDARAAGNVRSGEDSIGSVATVPRNADGIPVSTWPGNVSRPGFCGVTNDGVEGSCRGKRPSQGSWSVRDHRIISFAECAARCALCANCRFVTYSPSEDDCSWYSRCNLNHLGVMPGFYSAEVVREAGPLRPVSSGEGNAFREARFTVQATEAYSRRVSADRALHTQMVQGALVQLLGSVTELLSEKAIVSTMRIAHSQHITVARVSGALKPSALVMPFGCLEPDFVLHNRQLLPTLQDIEACGAPAHNASGGAAAAKQAGAQSTIASAMARARLRSLLSRLRRRAETSNCARGTSVQKDMHLSGFSSMISSVIKPWTAAIRLNIAMQTPLAQGIMSAAKCRRRPLDLGCFFEPIGPSCESGVGRRAPDLRLNLAQLRRESPIAREGAAIPAEFRPWGAFWWVSALLSELTKPNEELAMRLRHAAEESGLARALEAGELVIGMHIRHGDSCSASEASRTCRTCEPLDVYLRAVGNYAYSVGASAVFLATDSQEVIDAANAAAMYMADAAATSAAPYGGARLRFLFVRSNVSRSSNTPGAPPPELLDNLLKRRAATRGDESGILASHATALAGVIDTLLLAQTAILVGKFTSGVFRHAYALAAVEAEGLKPFVSLDAPWCADYGLPAVYNDDFPERGRAAARTARMRAAAEEQVVVAAARLEAPITGSASGGGGSEAHSVVRMAHANVCSC